MSIADISPAAVLHHIQAGKRTKAALAEEFEVLPSFLHLSDAIDALVADGQIRVNDRGEYIPHDLLEDLEEQ